MATDAETEMKKSRRKSETPLERLARLQRDVEQAKQAAKVHQHRAYAVLGGAVLDEAKADARVMQMLREILERRVKNKGQLAAVLELL